jgi:hypothetical protein
MALQSEKSKNKPPIGNDGEQNIPKQPVCQQMVIKTCSLADVGNLSTVGLMWFRYFLPPFQRPE